MPDILKQAARLLCVKSLVTLMLTGVFVVMAVRGSVSQDFMTMYTVVVSFYFGTQHERVGASVRGEEL